MDKIRVAFKDYFADFKVELPPVLESEGHFRYAGWSVLYRLKSNEVGEPYLNVIAEHRMASTRYFRILANGEVITFDGFSDHYSYDDPSEEAAAQEKLRQYNDKVAAVLKAEGFLD